MGNVFTHFGFFVLPIRRADAWLQRRRYETWSCKTHPTCKWHGCSMGKLEYSRVIKGSCREG